MTTKAIEGGARKVRDLQLSIGAYTATLTDEVAERISRTIIEAAIASGELVPASADHTTLADELDGWHECADGDVSAGNGHFRLVCVSDSDQQRLNLRATLREAAKTLRSMVPASAVAADHLDHLEGGLQLLLAAAKAGDPHKEIAWRAEEELRQVARLRALSPEPASGEFVVGWRTMDSAPKDGRPIAVIHWWPSYVDDKPGQWGPATTFAYEQDPGREQCWTDSHRTTCIREDRWIERYRWSPLPVGLPEPPALLNAATKDGERK